MPTFGWLHVGFLLQGLLWTLALTLIAGLGGGLLGFAVALARISRLSWLRSLAMVYVQVLQGTPLLILMFLGYFGFTLLGFQRLPAIVAAGAAMTLFASAYLGEIWRGCIQSVPRTQWEAAECLGLSRWAQLRFVVLPQALRIAVPPTVGFSVQIVKNTSLASVVGFVELAQAGKLVNNSTFQPFIVYLLVAVLYFWVCWPLSAWSRRLERKLNVGRR
jgi:polar amino acid transport system permease protein